MGAGPVATTKGSAAYTHLLHSRPWYRNTRMFLTATTFLTSYTYGFDGSMMNGLQSLTQWNQAFDYPTGGKLGLLNAIQNIGALSAYPFAPYMADGMGRRFSIIFGASLMVAATAIQTTSNSVQMFIGARFLVGFGLTLAAVAAPLLVTEIAYPSHRAQATSLYSPMWYLGSIVAAWTVSICHSQQTPNVISLADLWHFYYNHQLGVENSFCTPRGFIHNTNLVDLVRPRVTTLAREQGKGGACLSKFLLTITPTANAQDPLVQYEFEEIKAAIAFDREVAGNVGWLSLIKTPGNRKRMRIVIALAVFSQWSGYGLVSYYLNKVFIAIGITDPTTQLLINGLLNTYNFIVTIIAGFYCDRVGRRTLFVTSCSGMAVFWTAQTICFSIHQTTGSITAGYAVVVFISQSFSTHFSTIAFPPLLTSYTVEIFPFDLRAKGYIVSSFVLSLFLIFNQYVNPIALDALQWKYYLVYVFWLCFEAVFCYFFIVETRNRTLEATAAIFDGDEGKARKDENTAAHADPMHEGKETKLEFEVATTN
ncbi:general substrate transporter [Suillus lakei]|nr:general substrate transporter [Suillus lakei]